MGGRHPGSIPRGAAALSVGMLSVAVVQGVVIMSMQPARAATRVCRDIVAASAEDKTSEIAARQKAMSSWTLAAGTLGPAFALWRNATEKSLSCLKLQDGTHRCQAYGRPCGISQVPGGQPLGVPPPVPAKPKAKGIDA